MASSKKQEKQKKDKQQESKDEDREGKLDLDDRTAGTDEPDPSLDHADKFPKKFPTLPVSPPQKNQQQTQQLQQALAPSTIHLVDPMDLRQ